MASKWSKLKKALGFHLCTNAPKTLDESPPSGLISDPSRSIENPPATAATSDYRPATGSGQFSKSESKSFKKTCAICLGGMKFGHGQALFTAECSHTFHFNCISSNVKHGNYICPVCRAKWKEIPFQVPSPSDHPQGRTRVNPLNWPHHQTNNSVTVRTPEPTNFDDDEPLYIPPLPLPSHECLGTVDIKMYPEYKAVEQSASDESFAILIHLKAPKSLPTRAPVDLVAVLDVSGSMSGTKLTLLKRAMCFLIQNLSPSDRLSVVAFSNSARRLFHLHRMSESGCQLAVQAVNSLTCCGGTNIVEGLRKGVKILEDRKERNPVCSIILLSDGQDTNPTASPARYPVPVHSFGFGDDHDSVYMHDISENSGGTFSYIESENVIQDAFAQCIGGLLSVVVQEMDVKLESVHPGVEISSIKSGSYKHELKEDHLGGLIHGGDFYAEEERDFLVNVTLPRASEEMMTLLTVDCSYKHPGSNKTATVEKKGVDIKRPVSVAEREISIEVDRERNRLLVAEAMAKAKAAAEARKLKEAVSILENCQRMLSESWTGRAGDPACTDLNAELNEVRERMASQRRYNESGRAYVLSGLSSHTRQRATSRGDWMTTTSFQTPSMVEMLQRSQTFGTPPRRGAVSEQLKQARSFNLRFRAS